MRNTAIAAVIFSTLSVAPAAAEDWDLVNGELSASQERMSALLASDDQSRALLAAAASGDEAATRTWWEWLWGEAPSVDRRTNLAAEIVDAHYEITNPTSDNNQSRIRQMRCNMMSGGARARAGEC